MKRTGKLKCLAGGFAAVAMAGFFWQTAADSTREAPGRGGAPPVLIGRKGPEQMPVSPTRMMAAAATEPPHASPRKQFPIARTASGEAGFAKRPDDRKAAGERETAPESLPVFSGAGDGRKKAVSGAGAKPQRSLAVPAAMAGNPLPFFLKAEEETRQTGDGEEETAPNLTEEMVLTPQEAAAVEEAAEIFAHAMEAAPTKSETEPVYEDWWRASTLRAEEHLRAVLGWDRFNRLSLDAAREFLAESAR